MPDLKEWFGTLDRVPAPDLWRKVERRRPAELSLDRSGRRVAVAILALAVAAAGVGAAVWAFVGREGGRPVATPLPIRPKANGAIAFVSRPSSPVPFVHVVRADGKGLVDLAPGGSPSWSPDGTRIAFVGRGGINVMNADGGGVTLLSHCGRPQCDDDQPTWSPDGKQIAFVRGGAVYSGDIYVMNADGSSVRRLTRARTKDGVWQPAWSPDGTRIAFTVVRAPPRDVSEIYVMNADGTEVRKLTDCGGQNCSDSAPSWSPDGRRIAFVRTYAIYEMDADGSAVRALVSCSGIPNCVLVRDPEWSPDGSEVVFTVEGQDSHRPRLFTIELATGKTRALLPPKVFACCPAWQPLPSG